MKPIDFDAKLRSYLETWMKENAGKYRDVDEMESHVADAFASFADTRWDWLDGQSPTEYFDSLTDANALVQGLIDYECAGMDAPDLMLSRICALGSDAVEPLIALLRDENAKEALRVTAINLLTSLQAQSAMADCFELIDKESPLMDVAAELLSSLGETAVPGMMERLETAKKRALIIYLDLLCNFPGPECIYHYTEREFVNNPSDRALYASLLGRLGDPRAIEILQRVGAMEDTNYLDALEIANAIEMLGGDAPLRDRDFSGDPYYESLRQLES